MRGGDGMTFKLETNGPMASRRTALLGLGSGAALVGLAGCSGIDVGGGSFGGSNTGPGGNQQQAAPGATIGTGAVRIGLILPLSAGGNAGNIATNLRNAAELAVSEFSGPISPF